MTDSLFAEVRRLYNTQILERVRNPRHAGRLDPADTTARADNPMCGDRVDVWLRLRDGAIAAAGFEARGCEISKASADLMAETVTGATPEHACDLAEAFEGMARTGICPECAPELAALAPLATVHEFPSRITCATLPWRALTAALDHLAEAAP